MRERWATYRDAQTFANIVRRAPLYPLNSLMTHGLIHGPMAEGSMLVVGGTNLLHEARCFLGSGTQLQELYLTPGWMNQKSWDQVAAALHWARAREDILADTH